MSGSDKQRVETLVLQSIHDSESIADSYAFALEQNISHEVVVGVMKSLLTDAFVASQELTTSFYVLTEEAKSFLAQGSPEVRVFNAIPAEDGITRPELEAIVGAAVLKFGQGAAMKNKWIRMDKASGKVFRNVESVVDEATQVLHRIEASGGAMSAVSKDEAATLKRRSLVEIRTRKSYTLTKGANFSLQRKKQAAGLTKEMLERYIRMYGFTID